MHESDAPQVPVINQSGNPNGINEAS